MSLMESVQKIVNGYDIETKPWGDVLGLVNGKMITLNAEVTSELLSSVFSKISDLFGAPIYTHSYYGYIWKVNGEYLAYKLHEKSYNNEVIALLILNRMPIGRKMKYSEYVQIEEMVRQVFSEYNLSCDNFVHYIDGCFRIWGESAERNCYLLLKPHSLKFSCSRTVSHYDGTIKTKPCYSRKERISLRDLSEVKRTLENCFIGG